MRIFKAFLLVFVSLGKARLMTQQGTRLSALVIDDIHLWTFRCTKMRPFCIVRSLGIEKAILLNNKILCLCFFLSLEKNQRHPPLAPLNKPSACFTKPILFFLHRGFPKQTYLSLPLFACFYYAFSSIMEAKKGCELMYWPFTFKRSGFQFF